jgi:endonuclease YncB( thermonuclease family)
MMRKLICLVPFLLFFLPLVVEAQGTDPWKNRAVISVIDGDTVVLDNGEMVRLIGVLAPRAKHGKQPGEPFGEQARNITEELLLGKQVEISFDIAYGPNGHRDKDGRAMAYLTITRGAEKAIANMELLKLGAGYLAPIPESLQFGDVLKSAEGDARKRKTGVWTQTDKSPQEVATAAGKTFEEPAASVSLIYIKPIGPILQGPGVKPNSVAANRTTDTPNGTPNTSGKRASIDMEDLRKVDPNAIKRAEARNNPVVKNENENLYKLTERRVFYSLLEPDQKLEMYFASTLDGDKDYRVSIKQGEKEIVMITNRNGLKNFDRLLNKGTESQPTLSAVEVTVGSMNGSHGSVTVSTGKDGGVVLNLTGKDGSTKMYLNRQNALKMQIAIGGQ